MFPKNYRKLVKAKTASFFKTYDFNALLKKLSDSDLYSFLMSIEDDLMQYAQCDDIKEPCKKFVERFFEDRPDIKQHIKEYDEFSPDLSFATHANIVINSSHNQSNEDLKEHIYGILSYFNDENIFFRFMPFDDIQRLIFLMHCDKFFLPVTFDLNNVKKNYSIDTMEDLIALCLLSVFAFYSYILAQHNNNE